LTTSHRLQPQTWGEFAELVGYTWEDLLTNLVPDPRQCAYDVLVKNVPAEMLHDPRLDGLLVTGV